MRSNALVTRRWKYMESVDCWNLWVLVRANPDRTGYSVGRPPEGVLVPVGFVKPLSGRDCV